MWKIDVIIPTYRPGQEFESLLNGLLRQNQPIQKIIIMNTEKKFWNTEWEKMSNLLEVHHLAKADFDHGGTRKLAASFSDAEIMVFMTQDAVPANEQLLTKLTEPFQDEKVGASYARQLPADDCNELEQYTRRFNYPPRSSVKTKADLPEYGIKTFFCSNVCAAYRKTIFQELGGFVEKTIFNEDMIYAGTLIDHDFAIAYAAEAQVIHSHNYSCMQQLHRNFDLGVSQAQYREVFEGIASEGEGIRLVKKTMGHLIKKGYWWMVPKLIMQSGCKYVGYFVGKRYQRLPKAVLMWFTMNKSYWD